MFFSSNRSGNYELYLKDLESGNITQLTDTPEDELYARASPNGKLVLFFRMGEGAYVLNLEENTRDKIYGPSIAFRPIWGRNGTKLYFSVIRWTRQNITTIYSKRIVPSGVEDLQVNKGEDFVSLNWTAPDDNNISNYNIYRDGELIASVNSSSSTYKDTEVEAETEYKYQVTAENEFTESEREEEVTVQTPSSSSSYLPSLIPEELILPMIIASTALVLAVSFKLYKKYG